MSTHRTAQTTPLERPANGNLLARTTVYPSNSTESAGGQHE
ncbi:hypothetical protein [Natronorubrum bangense]|nr:hypothetical protein [Natronorubrum bangense]